jgi:hypothetical protein
MNYTRLLTKMIYELDLSIGSLWSNSIIEELSSSISHEPKLLDIKKSNILGPQGYI